ncbi:MAG: DUF1549 domain-containing protein, partial [Planctomycetaceae bacterium]|nr:DUF1549 domain-containing protein [Planctomycetaceae bacterium]
MIRRILRLCARMPSASAFARNGTRLTVTAVMWLLAIMLCPAVFSQELPPADLQVPVVIDQLVDAALADRHITATETADADTVLRRTTLDLAGRIPTSAERDWYLTQPAQTRGAALIDHLMNLPDFDLHLRNTLDEMLLPDRPNDNDFREYLLHAVQQHQPWSEMFREMLLAEEKEGPEKGAAQFVRSRVRELDDLTNDTAVLFFGVNISCAKCHDHPLVEDWKQDHFYGMQAFFSRTFSTKKNRVAEKPFGEVKFTTTAGEDRKADFMFLTGTIAVDQTPAYSDEEKKQLEEQIRQLEREDDAEMLEAGFSPRQLLVDMALNDSDDLYLARNMVNRTWGRLMGTAIVDPPDQMHSGNPPSHPQLLTWLARDFATHEYDLRRLIRGIVSSRAYARSSEWVSESPAPAAATFAVAATRPLTPRQLAAS